MRTTVRDEAYSLQKHFHKRDGFWIKKSVARTTTGLSRKQKNELNCQRCTYLGITHSET